MFSEEAVIVSGGWWFYKIFVVKRISRTRHTNQEHKRHGKGNRNVRSIAASHKGKLTEKFRLLPWIWIQSSSCLTYLRHFLHATGYKMGQRGVLVLLLSMHLTPFGSGQSLELYVMPLLFAVMKLLNYFGFMCFSFRYVHHVFVPPSPRFDQIVTVTVLPQFEYYGFSYSFNSAREWRWKDWAIYFRLLDMLVMLECTENKIIMRIILTYAMIYRRLHLREHKHCHDEVMCCFAEKWEEVDEMRYASSVQFANKNS